MRNADYWRGRFSILEDSAHREAQKTIQGMEELPSRTSFDTFRLLCFAPP